MKTDQDLIFEAYVSKKVLTEGSVSSNILAATFKKLQDSQSKEETESFMLPFLAEYGQDGLTEFAEYVKSMELEEDNEDYDVEEGNIFERLEELLRNKPELENDLKPILNDFQDIIEDINSLDVDDYKIDVTELGLHLNRLFPDV